MLTKDKRIQLGITKSERKGIIDFLFVDNFNKNMSLDKVDLVAWWNSNLNTNKFNLGRKNESV